MEAMSRSSLCVQKHNENDGDVSLSFSLSLYIIIQRVVRTERSVTIESLAVCMPHMDKQCSKGWTTVFSIVKSHWYFHIHEKYLIKFPQLYIEFVL